MEATIHTLHEGQLSMDNNKKILMFKTGIQTGCQPKKTAKNKENTRTATESYTHEFNTLLNVDDINTQREDDEMDRAEELTELTDEVFGDVRQ